MLTRTPDCKPISGGTMYTYVCSIAPDAHAYVLTSRQEYLAGVHMSHLAALDLSVVQDKVFAIGREWGKGCVCMGYCMGAERG